MSMFPPPPPGQGPVDPRAAIGASPGYPPMQPMPPMMPPPYPVFMPPPPRGGGWAKAILLTLATTIFGLSLTLNLYFLVYLGLTSAEGAGRVETQVIREGDARQTIAVVPLAGVIDTQAFERFDKLLKAVEENANVKAVVVEIDSPGGEVTASDRIYRRLKKFREDSRVPVVANMESLAASGGYYVACAAQHIVAHPTTITGSIGVRLDRLSLAGLGEKYGIEDNSIHSTGADFKNVGSIWKRDTPEETKYLLSLIDDAFEQFKRVVADGRKLSRQAVDAAANGKAYTSNQALPLKLIDQIGYNDDAYAKAASMAGLSKPQIVQYKSQLTIWEALSAESSLKSQASFPKFDRSTLHSLATPKMMYLWTGQ